MAAGFSDRYRRVDELTCAAAYVDCEGAILVENDAFRALRVSGTDASSIEEHTLPVLFGPGDREAVRDLLAARGGRLRQPSRAMTIAGSVAPMLAEFVPITRRSHAGIVWLVTLRPPEEPSEPSAELAPGAPLTAGIVHDLRAPVQVVLGWASLLKRKHDEPRHLEHGLQVIERNAELLIDLLEDFLEQTRPSSSRAPLRRRKLDLAELVGAEVRALQPLAAESGVRLSLTTGSTAVAVQGNEIHLRRIVINLLGNALKFTPRDGAVECRLWRSGAWAGLAVRDTGPGIAGEFLPKVFDAFVQEPDSHEDGFGLGLAVVRSLVEQHGGSVTAASAGNGRGATFTVLLPAVPMPLVDDSQYAASLRD